MGVKGLRNTRQLTRFNFLKDAFCQKKGELRFGESRALRMQGSSAQKDSEEVPPAPQRVRYQWGPVSNEKKRKLDVTFGDIHAQNIGQLRKLNEHAFPLTYADKFYAEIPTLSKDFTQFAYFGGFVVGAICGRVEPLQFQGKVKKKLYIMTIGVLVAYRERGIGRMLLNYLLDNAAKQPDIAFVYLHVQTSNEGALEFYRKNGFQNLGMIPKYYKRIEPPDCFVLCKLVNDFDGANNDIADVLGVPPPSPTTDPDVRPDSSS